LREIFQLELDPELADKLAQAVIAWRGDFHQKRMVHNTLELRHIIDSAVSEHKAAMSAVTEGSAQEESGNEEWAHRRGRWLNRTRREREVRSSCSPSACVSVDSCYCSSYCDPGETVVKQQS
jgi:hypothetical protein